MLNTHSNGYILNMWHHVSRKLALGVAVRGDGGVAGEGRVVGVPKVHSGVSAPCHALTNINSDWMPNASYDLRIILQDLKM